MCATQKEKEEDFLSFLPEGERKKRGIDSLRYKFQSTELSRERIPHLQRKEKRKKKEVLPLPRMSEGESRGRRGANAEK